MRSLILQIIPISEDYDFGNFPIEHETKGGTWRVLGEKKTEENSKGKGENESWDPKQVLVLTTARFILSNH